MILLVILLLKIILLIIIYINITFSICECVIFLVAIWNEHQTKIDMAHKLLRTAQDKLEEQIKMRKEQVSIHRES